MHIDCTCSVTNKSSPCHEQGTNFGMKSHSAPLKGTMGVKKAASVLNTQSALKAAELDQMCYEEFMRNEKKWSDTITANYTVNLGEGLIKEEYQREHLYAAKFVGNANFEVTYNGDDTEYEGSRKITEDGNDNFPDVPLPLFSRVRKVAIDTNGEMRCNCHKFDTKGYFCVHCVCVACLVCEGQGEMFPGFTHNDLIPRYRNDFMYLAYRDGTPTEVQLSFHTMAMKELKGPKLNLKASFSVKAEPKSQERPAKERLKNYPCDDIDLTLVDGMRVSTFSPVTSDKEKEVAQNLEKMLHQLKDKSSKEPTELFSKSLDNSSIP